MTYHNKLWFLVLIFSGLRVLFKSKMLTLCSFIVSLPTNWSKTVVRIGNNIKTWYVPTFWQQTTKYLSQMFLFFVQHQLTLNVVKESFEFKYSRTSVFGLQRPTHFCINLTVKLFYCLLSGSFRVLPLLSWCTCDFKNVIFISLRFQRIVLKLFYFVRISIIL